MKNGTHSKKVQAEYDKYKELPSLEILAECTKEELNDYENECIEIWDSVNNGLNTLETAEGAPESPSVSGGEVSFRTYSKEDIEIVFGYLVHMPELSYPEIEELSGVSKMCVNHISLGRSHTWLAEEFPDDYEKLIDLRSIRYKNTLNTASKHLTAEKKGITYPKLLSPCGKVYEITNVRGFASEHSLDPGTLSRLLNQTSRKGHRPPSHHKGWRLAPEQGAQHAS